MTTRNYVIHDHGDINQQAHACQLVTEAETGEIGFGPLIKRIHPAYVDAQYEPTRIYSKDILEEISDQLAQTVYEKFIEEGIDDVAPEDICDDCLAEQAMEEVEDLIHEAQKELKQEVEDLIDVIAEQSEYISELQSDLIEAQRDLLELF